MGPRSTKWPTSTNVPPNFTSPKPLRNGRFEARAFEHDVGALGSRGECFHLLASFCSGSDLFDIDCSVGAKALCQIEPLGRSPDHDQFSGSAQLGPDQGHQPDCPRSLDDDGIAELNTPAHDRVNAYREGLGEHRDFRGEIGFQEAGSGFVEIDIVGKSTA